MTHFADCALLNENSVIPTWVSSRRGGWLNEGRRGLHYSFSTYSTRQRYLTPARCDCLRRKNIQFRIPHSIFTVRGDGSELCGGCSDWLTDTDLHSPLHIDKRTQVCCTSSVIVPLRRQKSLMIPAPSSDCVTVVRPTPCRGFACKWHQAAVVQPAEQPSKMLC